MVEGSFPFTTLRICQNAGSLFSTILCFIDVQRFTALTLKCEWVNNGSKEEIRAIWLVMLCLPLVFVQREMHLERKEAHFNYKSQCAGRHFRTKLMSQYIGSNQKKTVGCEDSETCFKSSKSWALFEKTTFLGPIFRVLTIFSCIVAIFAPILMKFWLQG